MARDSSGQKRHWQKVKAVAADLDIHPQHVQFHWSTIKPMIEAIHKGDPAVKLRAVGICVDQEDYGDELCQIAAIITCNPKHLRKHAKLLAPMREKLLAGDPTAIDFVRALTDTETKVPVGMANVVDKLVEEKLDKIKKSDTKAHFQIMAWAVEKIGGIAEAEKALAAVKVMAS